MCRTIRRLTLIALLACLSHGAEAGEPEASRTDAQQPAIASCVLHQPSHTQPLLTLEGGMVLATHRCSGGLYLLPAGEDPADPGTMARVIPLHQGWWLESLIGASWDGREVIDICGRFMTGIGPSGATPFTARLLIRRQAGRWQPAQIMVATETASPHDGGDGTCATGFQALP